MSNFKNIVVSVLVFFGVASVIGAIVDKNEVKELNKPATTSAPVRGYDLEVEPNTGQWTNAKEIFYIACVDEAPELEQYCVCSANYMLDTYGVNKVAEWGNSGELPEHVINYLLANCL